MHSSRILSRSSPIRPSSSASSSPFWKKLVGGSCFVSPTMMALSPRARAPMASQTGICEASSKMTTSNFILPAVKNCAMDRGLIKRQGVSCCKRSGIFSSNMRTGKWRLFLVTSFCRISHWLCGPSGAERNDSAMLSTVIRRISSSRSRKSDMRRSWTCRLNLRSAGSSSTTPQSHQRA